MNVHIVTKRLDKKWEGAVISEGKFLRALVGADLFKMLQTPLLPFLLSDRPEGTEVEIKISVVTPEEPKDGEN